MSLSSLGVPACVVVACVGCFAASPLLAQDVSRSPVNPMQGVDKAALKAFVHEPLFNPSRRLPRAPAPVAYAPPPPIVIPPAPPPNIQLVGVIEGDDAIAIVRNGTDQKTSMLHAGDHIGPWTVTILPTGLKLTNGDRTADFALFQKSRAAARPRMNMGQRVPQPDL